MYFIRYITLAILSTLLFTTAVDAKAIDSLTKEQKEVYVSLQTKYQTFTEDYIEDFNNATSLQSKFIADHQLQFDNLIAIEKQFKEDNEESIDKLNIARKKFQENHPNAILGPKNFLFKDDGTTEEKYLSIYSKLEHHAQNPTKHLHFKIKTELQQKFFNNNKETILTLKNAHEKFMKEHSNDINQLQNDYNNYYKENSNVLEKVSNLKLQFLKDNKSDIEKLGSAAPMFFHEIGVTKKFKY